MSNTPYRDNNKVDLPLLRQALDVLETFLPSEWNLRIVDSGPAASDYPLFDTLLTIQPNSGPTATIVIEAKQSVEPREVPFIASIASQLRATEDWASMVLRPILLVAAPYLSGRTREKLRASDLNYIDLTGNVHLQIDNPAVYISAQGADKDPFRRARPMRTLRGAKAARIVRVLADFQAPLGIRQIAEYARTDPGYVSRVTKMLVAEDLASRGAQGNVESVDWEALLRVWTQYYSLLDSNKPSKYLAPRGLDDFLERLKGLRTKTRYALTGSLAARRYAPFAPARLGTVFVNDPAVAAGQLDLVSADAGANVLLVKPKGVFVYDRSVVKDDLVFVAASQAAADLRTGPGRNPEESEELLAWMRNNPDEWRTKP